jgi:50S ribosomal protein L16 3-hydroxylase
MESELLLSVNGENYPLPLSDLKAVKQLTDFIEFDTNTLNSTTPSLDFIETFTTLVNEGIWFS